MHTYVRTFKWHRENTEWKRKKMMQNIVVIYVWRKKNTAECTSHQISANRYCSNKGKQRADTQALLSNHHKKKILQRIAEKKPLLKHYVYKYEAEINWKYMVTFYCDKHMILSGQFILGPKFCNRLCIFVTECWTAFWLCFKTTSIVSPCIVCVCVCNIKI